MNCKKILATNKSQIFVDPDLIYAIHLVATQRAELNSDEGPMYSGHVKLETKSPT